MTLTATQIAHLNGDNEAHRLAAVGTLLASLEAQAAAHGVYTAVADDDTAGTVDINTGLATATTLIVQIYRSGVPLFQDQAVSMAAGVITVADGGATYALTAGDEIHYMVA